MGTDEMICKAARVSTGKDQEDNDKIKGLIGYLAREEHTSPFEHTGLSIRFEAPIFVHRQVMTHRTLSKNTQSGRYSDLAVEYHVPEEGRPLINAGSGAHPNLVAEKHGVTHEAAVISMRDSYEYAAGIYNYLTAGDPEIDDVIATEVARAVQPTAQYTAWYMTGNLYAWFQFLERRDGSDGHPQHEIQDLANQVWPILEEHWPIATKAWRERNKGKLRKTLDQWLLELGERVNGLKTVEQTIEAIAAWAEENNK